MSNTSLSDTDTPSTDDVTPADRRRQRVRDLILDAAETLFAEEGEAGLTIRGIAERIDYSPGAIYQYFRSKEAILQTIREMFFARLLERLDDVTAGRDMSVACMQDGLRAYIDCGLEQPNHYRMAFAEGAEAMPEEDTADVPQDSKMLEAAQRLQGMVCGLVEAGLIAPLDPALAASSVWPCLHGLTLLLVEHPDFPHKMLGSNHINREALIDFHITMLVRGLGAPDTRMTL